MTTSEHRGQRWQYLKRAWPCRNQDRQSREHLLRAKHPLQIFESSYLLRCRIVRHLRRLRHWEHPSRPRDRSRCPRSWQQCSRVLEIEEKDVRWSKGDWMSLTRLTDTSSCSLELPYISIEQQERLAKTQHSLSR